MNNQCLTLRKMVRTDSWAASLTEHQQWELYFRSKSTENWVEPLLWAQKEFGLTKLPSRSSFYRWRNRLWKCEQKQRLLDVAVAAASAKDFATVCLDSETLIKTFTTLSVNEAMGSGNAKTTYEWIKSAEALHRMICANKRIEFAEHSVEIKEAYLDLAERRFELWRRKFEIWCSKNETKMPKRADPPRRPERLKEELDRMFGHPPYAAAQSA